MWFKNIKTGVEWDISNPEHIKRLFADKDYQVVEKADIVDLSKYEYTLQLDKSNCKSAMKATKAKTTSKKGG